VISHHIKAQKKERWTMAGMKGLKKQRRVQIIVLAFVALTVSTGLIGYAMKDGINFFRSPTQVVEDPPRAGEVFRIGGLVEEGSIERGQSETVNFRVTDTNQTIPVRFTGILPDLFSEGQGMVGTGFMEDGTFVATEILAKHDETYMPREVIDALKEQGVYQDAGSDS
jgi:cytochrome c-type biogenesis protein CcmE